MAVFSSFKILLLRNAHIKHLQNIGKYDNNLTSLLRCNTFCTQMKNSDQNMESKDEEYEYEYYDDEYSDDEDEGFEEEGVKWEYDAQGIGISKETGQPVFFTPKPQLELPHGIKFFLRIFGIIIAIGTALTISWYSGKLTLFGDRYDPENQRKISQVFRQKTGDENIPMDYKRDGTKQPESILATEGAEQDSKKKDKDDITSLIQRI